ncbi:sigma-70 family RNA polymerase sigma factor [Mycolicibacterium litorale]|uniref:RNA polymerase sigma factor n=1 Tax=Mycolicibacterium litorale TaxID=758802 RepID=A0AAD1MS96_9MYCO|nr:sigma-70 family RNA polymerase sigma factor [Mycolicibacterium litorale]MCV7415806.1 sigma-70 family RNA polymerase sigma factor [Mycolicibacterium litorale]TDY09057.1 RNA polymerase RpoE-like sigma-24 subunit [Mycolicibacterium litorale]BBY16994.1 ECF RNA polymerase sigma factor SigH [Mycolicibacterium litorale]
MTVTPVQPTSEPDRDLAARFADDTQPLFDALARKARRLTRCEADAEDLLQETLMHAYAGFHTFKEGSNVKAWLFRILYNRWVSTYRAKQCRPLEVPVDDITERELADSASRTPAGARSAEAEALAGLPDGEIRAALGGLPHGFREALYLADVEEYTYAEIAAILDIPLGTVMSRVSRGRGRLRIALAHLADGRGRFAPAQQCAA